MTPLQQAAQAVIARWESPKWKDEAPTAVVIGALLKALTDEQAQAGVPVARVAGVDEYGPRIDWYVHWANFCGADLYTNPPPAQAQQVAVPMTEAQIFACDPVPHVMFDQQRIDFARAIEAFHGITGAKS